MNSFPFWLLLGSAALFGGLYMLLSHRESRRMQLEALAWLQKINELVDVHDDENDGHLEEYLDDSPIRLAATVHHEDTKTRKKTRSRPGLGRGL